RPRRRRAPPGGPRLAARAGCRALRGSWVAARSRHGRLLHCHRLPAAVATDEDARVADLAAEREAAERPGVVGDAPEHGDVAVDPHGEAVVVHGRQPQLPARDIAEIVRPGAELAEPRDLEELVGHQT